MNYADIAGAYHAGLESQGKKPTKNYLRMHESALRKTLVYQLAEYHGCSDDEALTRLETDDLTPHLASAIATAEGLAKRNNQHPNLVNRVSAVRRMLTTAFPREFTRASPTGASFTVPSDWQPLLDACAAHYAKPAVARAREYTMRTMAKAMFAERILSPTQLPARAEVEAILQRHGCSYETALDAIVGYRVLLRRVQAMGLLPNAVHLEERPRPNERSLRSLPRTHFVHGGGLPAGKHPIDLTAEQLLPLICPLIARELDEWKRKRGSVFRPRTHSSAMYGICQVVTELAKNPALLAASYWPDGMRADQPKPVLGELRLWHLLELRHPAGAPLAAVDDTEAARSANDDEPIEAPTSSLLFAALEQYAVELRETTVVQGLLYPSWIRSVYAYVALVVRGLLARALKGKTRWARINEALRAEMLHMKISDQHSTRSGGKDKVFLVERVNLAQIVCVGLPRMAQRVRLLRAAWQTAESSAPARRGGVWSKRLGKARSAYLKALEEYVVVACLVADPLRIKNHTQGWVGPLDQYRIVLGNDATGRTIHSVTSTFSNDGRLNKSASLKQVKRKLHREWTWLPTLIDHALLLEYMLEVRWPRIVNAKVLKEKNGTPVAMGSQLVWDEMTAGAQVPLFVGPQAVPGNLIHWNLPIVFVRGFRRMLQETFKLHVPPTHYRGKTEWRGLLSPHVTRLLWASYWGGIRGDHGPVVDGGHSLSGWEIAMHATTDTRRVLERDYTVVTNWARNAARTSTKVAKGDHAAARELYRHPHAFDALMDRTYLQGAPVDWATERVPLPPGLCPLAEMRLPSDG